VLGGCIVQPCANFEQANAGGHIMTTIQQGGRLLVGAAAATDLGEARGDFQQSEQSSY
jgi:hypothetical protein